MNSPQPRPSRRQVLAAGAFLAHSPKALFGQPRSLEPVRLGVIGIGIRGRRLMQNAFLPNEGFRVVAVCDVDEARMLDGKRRVDEHYGTEDCAAVTKHEELLAGDAVDAVVIATPDHWHAHQILDACIAKKDIYCEKPLTLTLREAQLVIEGVRKHGVVFQTGSQQRSEFGHRFVAASEAVRAGRIGRVLNVNVGVGNPAVDCDLAGEDMEPGLDWDRWLGPAPRRPYHSVLSPRGVHSHYPKWRWYREYAGGGLADMGAHHFDIAQWALGMDESGPVRVIPPSDPEALRGAMVEYANGIRLVHGGPHGATFVGEKGVISVDRGRLGSLPESLLDWEAPEDQRLPRHGNHAANWLDRIRDRGKPICHEEVGARSVAICQLMNLAYQHRQEFEWGPAAWSLSGPEGSQAWRDYERREGYALPKA